MSQTEAAIRRAGALVAAASASALMRLPAGGHVSLALHVLLLLGCAAVQLAPAHRAVAGLARRAAEAARTREVAALGASGAGLRRAGLAGILLYALHDAADVRTDVAAEEEEEASVDKVKHFLLFFVFLAAVWAVYLSMVTGRGAPAPPRPSAAAQDGVGELNAPGCTCLC
jgi:hypothetical protein